jgi:hypothetical protein
MLWALLLLIAVIVAVHAWEYESDVREYSFAQPATMDRHDELSRLLQEKIPIAVEVGALPWRPVIVEKAGFQIETEEGSQSPADFVKAISPVENQEELATEMVLTTGLEDLNAGRPWWWLPSIRDCRVDILSTKVKPLTWTTAEREWIGCSHGGPVTVWLVHSAYRKYLGPSTSSLDPWSATVAEVPWWGRVKFVEVTVKPGWCLGIPAHWGFAARCSDEPAWIWMGDQHSLASLAISNIFKSRDE